MKHSKKMIGMKKKISKKDRKEIDERLDKAEALVDKYGINLDEAIRIVNEAKIVEDVLKKINNK